MSSFVVEEPETEEDARHLKLMAEMERRYDLLMPIDGEYDPSWCRDKFLRQLFTELDLDESVGESSSSSSGIFQRAPFTSTMSLTSFIQFGPRMIRTTKVLDRLSIKDIYPHEYKLSVMTGRTDRRYGELLESMQRSSLFFMFSRVLNRLRIMQSISLDWGGIHLNDLPHKVFKWSMDGFFTRCMLPDDVYIDVLTINYSSDVLDWAKFSTDLLEILRYYKYFYMEVYNNKGDYEKMLAILWDQQHMLNIGEQLDKDLQISYKTFDKIGEQARKMTSQWWGQHRHNMAKICKRRSMEAIVRLPIEWRYLRNYFASLVEMQTLKDNLPVLQLEEQIGELKEAIVRDNNASHVTILVYNVMKENYQSRINEFSRKLAEEQEHWELQIVIAKLNLAKARDEYREARENIDFMRQRVKEVQALIEAERQAEIDKIANEQYVLQAEALRKAELRNVKRKQKRKVALAKKMQKTETKTSPKTVANQKALEGG